MDKETEFWLVFEAFKQMDSYDHCLKMEAIYTYVYNNDD